MDSYDLLVIEYLVLLSLAFFRGVTGLIMRSVKLEPNRFLSDDYSTTRSAFAAMSHWTLVNSNFFFRFLVIIFLAVQLPKVNVCRLGFVTGRLE